MLINIETVKVKHCTKYDESTYVYLKLIAEKVMKHHYKRNISIKENILKSYLSYHQIELIFKSKEQC